jgi:hypothetical protein
MRLFLLNIVLLFCVNCVAQNNQYEATKITTAIKIDGKIDELAWKNIPIISELTTAFPEYGKPSPNKTEVKITYDNTAFYVAAILYDDVKNIRKQLSQRDVIDRQDADNFSIGFDTYLDKQNGFLFTVTAAGVQGDAKLSNNNTDRSWDAVWESAISTFENGWIVEMKIPLSAIRFPKKEKQDWGLQVSRFLRKPNINTTWFPQNPNIDGSLNQWGIIHNLVNITPPLRLSFLPYISGGVRNSPTNNGNVTEYLKSGGMDVKYGINESFTLDMTLIPDFAQVQSDNLFLNLSPFQVKFDDFRPFFTEGTELFNKSGLFYSRRIGATPSGVYNVLDFAANNTNYKINKNPGITRLYNATKLSGRTKNNIGIGVFNAITAPMKARLTNTLNNKDTIIETEVLTNYNVFVLDKALKNRSSVTFTNTNAMRQGNARNANVSALELNLFDKTNNYQLEATARYSSIWGTKEKYDGFSTGIRSGKVSGKWQYQGYISVESDKYDPNDIGFLQNNNSFKQGANVKLQYTKPSKNYLSHSYNLNFNNNYLYSPFKWQELSINAGAFFLFKNFWDTRIIFNAKPSYFNDFFESRTPGLKLNRFSYAFVAIGGSSDSRKKLFVNWFIGAAESAKVKDDPFYTMDLGARYRFSSKFQMQSSIGIQNDKGQWGYSHRDNVSTLVTGYNDPIIAFRKLKTNNLVLSAQYNFTSRMNWNVRLRHNWTHIENRSFHKLKTDGSWNDIAFVNGKDRNFNVFNVDMFYTWDFKWGSRLTLAWKNALGGNVALDPYLNPKFSQNISGVLNAPHSNEISLKVVYFLDYLNLKSRK